MNDELEKDMKRKAVTYFKVFSRNATANHAIRAILKRDATSSSASRRSGAIYALARFLPFIT
jgi:hypothetical protein